MNATVKTNNTTYDESIHCAGAVKFCFCTFHSCSAAKHVNIELGAGL